MSFTTVDRSHLHFYFWTTLVCLTLAVPALGQRLSILAQADSALSAELSQKVGEKLRAMNIRIDDMDLTRSAAGTIKLDNPFNMATVDARRLGSVLGTPFYVLVKAQNLRRTSSEVETYYEAFAAIYLVSSLNGQLVNWDLVSIKQATEIKSKQGLIDAADQAAKTIAEVIDRKPVADSGNQIEFPPVPDEKAPGFKDLRPPMPFRRISPEYTATANLYGIEATVEIEVDVDAEGKIARTEIVKWAGYGLDESVDQTIRKMNWRPATIGSKTLPMRVLLRYNFKKLEKDDDN
jgi:TonB family protein